MDIPSRKKAPDRTESALRLINAAERLFGQHGVDGISLVEIARQAGHANKSAVQYHFGTKAKLIRAIFDERLRSIGKRRGDMMAALREKGDATIPELIAALIEPISAEVSADGFHHYARFAHRILNSPLSDIAWINSVHANAGDVKQSLAALSPHLPPQAFEIRFVLALEQLSGALAAIDRNRLFDMTGDGAKMRLAATPAEILSHAIDMAAAAFTADPAG